MIELFQITNDPDFARRCDALDGVRVFVDLERLGKAERQAGATPSSACTRWTTWRV
jgi:hypothetical protein